MWDTPIDWNERFQKSVKLVRQEQYAEALKLLADCVAAEPHRVDFASLFLKTLTQRNGGEPVVDDESTREHPEFISEPPAQLLKLAPRWLVQHPHDLEMLYAIAQAHLATGHRPVALAYVEYALTQSPQHVSLLRLKARILTHLHREADAIACWQQVQALQPQGIDSVRAITNLVIHQSRRRAGWVKGEPLARETPPPVVPLADEPVMPPEVMNALYGTPEGPIKLTPVQKLQNALKDSPSLPGLYLHLVPMYLEKGQEFEAEKLLHKGIEATGDDPQVRQLWEDVSMMRMEKRIAELRRDLQEQESPQLSRELAQLVGERDELELKIYSHRAKREPENPEAGYQWGVRLKRAGKLEEAARAFSNVLQVESHACCAACELGECLEQEGELPEALQAYQKALEAASSPVQLEYRKRALYAAGRLAKQIKLFRLANRYFRELLQLDANYQDAAAQLQGMQNLLSNRNVNPQKLESAQTPPSAT